MAPVDAPVGGLRGYHKLRRNAVLLVNILPAEPVAVLLLDRSSHENFIPLGDQPQILHDLRPVDSGHHAPLLVRAPPAIDDVLRLIALIGVPLPVGRVAHAYRVNMPVKGDDLLPRAHPAQSVALRVDLRLVKPQLLHLPDGPPDHPLLLTALAGDGDQVPQKSAHVRLIPLGGPLDGFKIHSALLPSPPLDAPFRALCLYHIIEPPDVKQNFC